MELIRNFFNKDASKVAKCLLGGVLVRKIGGEILEARIVETEAYYGEDDPASWARFGKRKSNGAMWEAAGTILVKNVHKHNMLNFVTGEKGNPQAVLIRAVEPINFEARCNGPGLLSQALKITKELNGKNLFELEDFFIKPGKRPKEIVESFRIGVKKDLKVPLRFYIKGNKCVSRK